MQVSEVWKDIPEYEGLYQVSNLGRVKSFGRKGNHYKDKLIKLNKYKNGYIYVHLAKNGINKNVKVHRIVANTFILNPNNFSQINHKDENKENNCVDNLEWCDANYNNKYSKGIKIKVKNKIFDSIREVEKYYNLSHGMYKKYVKNGKWEIINGN